MAREFGYRRRTRSVIAGDRSESGCTPLSEFWPSTLTEPLRLLQFDFHVGGGANDVSFSDSDMPNPGVFGTGYG